MVLHEPKVEETKRVSVEISQGKAAAPAEQRLYLMLQMNKLKGAAMVRQKRDATKDCKDFAK